MCAPAPSGMGEVSGKMWGPRAASRSIVIVARRGRAQRYDAATARWIDLPPPPIQLVWVSAASLRGRVYVDCLPSAKLICLDPAAANGAEAWAAVAPMGASRQAQRSPRWTGCCTLREALATPVGFAA